MASSKSNRSTQNISRTNSFNDLSTSENGIAITRIETAIDSYVESAGTDIAKMYSNIDGERNVNMPVQRKEDGKTGTGGGGKRKRIVLTLAQKLKLIEQIESGVPVARIAADHGIGLTTVKDLKKNKEEIRKYFKEFDKCGESSVRKTLKMPSNGLLEDTVYKWYLHQLSLGMEIQDVDIQARAERIAREMGLQNFSASSSWLWRFLHRRGMKHWLLEDEDDSDYEEEEDDDNDEEEAEDDEEEKDRQKRRFEQVKKIVETSKTTNLKSRQDISTTVPRAMGQRNPSGRLVCAPDLSSSVNASSSLIDPLVLPGTSQTESILPTRIETESSSVSLVYEPHKAPKIEVEEEEIEEFGGESREICEEQTHIVSDLHTENLKEILLRLRAEKLVMELEKLKMDRKKLEAEKRNIGLRTKVLELRKKLASLESDEDEGRPLTSLPRADKSSEPRSEDFSPLPNESIFLRTSAIVQEDPLSDLNMMAKRVSSPLVKSATSGRSERKKAQSQLKKPVQQETSDQLCQVRRKSSDTVTKDDGMFSKSAAESIDVPGISNAPLHLHGTTDVKEEELSGDSLDSSNPGILESLLKVKQTEPQFPRLEGAKYVHEHREEETDSSFIHGSNINVCGSTHVGTEDDFAGPLAKRMKYADGPS